jgi:hypothetical protein
MYPNSGTTRDYSDLLANRCTNKLHFIPICQDFSLFRRPFSPMFPLRHPGVAFRRLPSSESVYGVGPRLISLLCLRNPSVEPRSECPMEPLPLWIQRATAGLVVWPDKEPFERLIMLFQAPLGPLVDPQQWLVSRRSILPQCPGPSLTGQFFNCPPSFRPQRSNPYYLVFFHGSAPGASGVRNSHLADIIHAPSPQAAAWASNFSVWSLCHSSGSLRVGHPSSTLIVMAYETTSCAPNHCSRVFPGTRFIGRGSKASRMRGVPDATRDLEVFLSERFYQFAFGIYLFGFLGLISGFRQMFLYPYGYVLWVSPYSYRTTMHNRTHVGIENG